MKTVGGWAGRRGIIVVGEAARCWYEGAKGGCPSPGFRRHVTWREKRSLGRNLHHEGLSEVLQPKIALLRLFLGDGMDEHITVAFILMSCCRQNGALSLILVERAGHHVMVAQSLRTPMT